MEGIGRRVEPVVAGDRPAGRETLGQAGRRRVEDAPPLELVEQARKARRRLGGRCPWVGSSPAPGAAPSHAWAGVRRATGPTAGTGLPSPAWYRSARYAHQPRPEATAAPTRPASSPRQRRRPRGRHHHPARPVRHPPAARSRRRARVRRGATTTCRRELQDPQQALDEITFTSQIGGLRPHRRGAAGQARRRPARGGDVRPDPARPGRCHDIDRGQDVLGELRVRSPGLHLGRRRHASTATTVAPRRSPSSWFGPGCCRRARSTRACTSARRRRSSSRSA